MKVLITELIWDIGIKNLQQFAEVEYDPTLWNDRDLLLAKAKNVDALIVRNQTKVDRPLLESAPRLKVVGRLGVGMDNIDLRSANELQITVVYGKNANAISVAEYVMAAILEISRPLTLANFDVKKGNWDRKRFTCDELYGKTLGLIGLGEISHRVAKRAAAFGMNMIGYDPFMTEFDYVTAETKVFLTTLDNLLINSDFISIHVPLTNQTRHLISTLELEKMKKSAYIINTARGGIIDEAALDLALHTKQIAGAYLDVLEQEPVDPLHPLLAHENVVITPHIAGLTEESQSRTSLLVTEEVRKVLKGERALCVAQ